MLSSQAATDSLKQMNDEKMMTLYKEGDQQAFTKLYEKYAPMVYGYLSKRLPNSEVDDAYQNVWRHLHEKRNCFSEQPFAPWFFHIIKNLLIDQYRSSARRSKLGEAYAEELRNLGETDIPDIEAIIADLPNDSKELVRRFYVDGQNYSEIEKALGVSQMSLRKRLSRVISQLRKNSEV